MKEIIYSIVGVFLSFIIGVHMKEIAKVCKEFNETKFTLFKRIARVFNSMAHYSAPLIIFAYITFVTGGNYIKTPSNDIVSLWIFFAFSLLSALISLLIYVKINFDIRKYKNIKLPDSIQNNKNIFYYLYWIFPVLSVVSLILLGTYFTDHFSGYRVINYILWSLAIVFYILSSCSIKIYLIININDLMNEPEILLTEDISSILEDWGIFSSLEQLTNKIELLVRKVEGKEYYVFLDSAFMMPVVQENIFGRVLTQKTAKKITENNKVIWGGVFKLGFYDIKRIQTLYPCPEFEWKIRTVTLLNNEEMKGVYSIEGEKYQGDPKKEMARALLIGKHWKKTFISTDICLLGKIQQDLFQTDDLVGAWLRMGKKMLQGNVVYKGGEILFLFPSYSFNGREIKNIIDPSNIFIEYADSSTRSISELGVKSVKMVLNQDAFPINNTFVVMRVLFFISKYGISTIHNPIFIEPNKRFEAYQNQLLGMEDNKNSA